MGSIIFSTGRSFYICTAAAVLLLTGCTDAADRGASTSDPVVSTGIATAAIQPALSGAASQMTDRTPTPGASSEPALGGCVPAVFTDRPQVGLEQQQIPNDQGAREYATGKLILGPDSIPVAYIVGTGDIPEYIADRFCVEVSYLDRINEPRRGSSGELFEGDTLNLDAATATTVGDVDGVIRQNPVSTSLPEQHDRVW